MKKKSATLANTLVLVVVTFVAILLLSVVYQVTKEPINQAEINARAEVYKVVYEDAKGFGEIDNIEALLEGSAEMLAGAGYDGCFINDVLAVVDPTDSSATPKGYVIAATSPSGYGGNVQVAIGITTDGTLTGFNVVSHSETAGLGSKCTEPDFTEQFKGKKAEPLAYSKTGASADNEIDAIGGATITTGAVTDAVNAAIAFYQANFGGGLAPVEEVDPMAKAFPDVTPEELTDMGISEAAGEDYTVNEVKDAKGEGYVVIVTAHNGYDGDLQIALGIGKDGLIKSFSTLICNETKTLGGQCTSDEFAAQFIGMKAEAVSRVASGAKMENNEIDMIAGATITTDAVLTAVNGAIEYYNNELKGA